MGSYILIVFWGLYVLKRALLVTLPSRNVRLAFSISKLVFVHKFMHCNGKKIAVMCIVTLLRWSFWCLGMMSTKCTPASITCEPDIIDGWYMYNGNKEYKQKWLNKQKFSIQIRFPYSICVINKHGTRCNKHCYKVMLTFEGFTSINDRDSYAFWSTLWIF